MGAIQSATSPFLSPVSIHRQTRFEAVFEGDSLNIQPGTESAVRVIFSPKFEGLFKATLELVFYHDQLSAWFVVRRMLRGIAGSLEDHRRLEFDEEDHNERTGIHRERPPQKIILLSPPGRCRKSRNIPDYEVPAIVQQVVDNSSAVRPYDLDAADLVSALRPDSLNMNTYAHYFASLLSIEDGHQQHARSGRWDIPCKLEHQDDVHERSRRYRRVPLSWSVLYIIVHRHFCSVEIENDDEDLLPEVALGDFLWLDDVQDNIRYEARITKIDVFTRRHLAVLKMSLRLPTDFNLYQGAQFVLQLRHNRTLLRYQYHALTVSFASPRRLLFPSMTDIKPKKDLSRDEIYTLKLRSLVNRSIRDDPQQLQAVVSVLEQPKGSVPFIIYGP
jgi:helicase MOV-10